MRLKHITLITIFFLSLSANILVAQNDTNDSIRVLISKYGKCNSGIDGVVTLSLIMEKDSANMPIYHIGDSTVLFFSEIKVDAIKNISFLKGNSLSKKLRKSMPNGLIIANLKNGESYPECQALPYGENLFRTSFVTRMSFSDLRNENGELSKLAEKWVSSYGTDDEAFRQEYQINRRASQILAIDTLGNKMFVKSLKDFKPSVIADITAYEPDVALQMIGDKGFNGLLLVTIKSHLTLKEALLSTVEKVALQAAELTNINFTTLVRRVPIVLHE